MGKMREKKKKKKKKKNLIETGNGDECSMNRSPFSLVWFGLVFGYGGCVGILVVLLSIAGGVYII